MLASSNARRRNLRKIRYDFFEKVRKKYKADAIAVGHNLNDQAETVLDANFAGDRASGTGRN